jgi:hypothetical protein
MPLICSSMKGQRSTMQENAHSRGFAGIKRRSVVTAAAWATPVVAAAASVPLAAASGEPTEEATYVYFGGDSGPKAGIWTGGLAEGRVEADGELVPGYLPAGTTITLTPRPEDAKISVRNLLGLSASENSDGTWTLVVLADIERVTWQQTLDRPGTITGTTSLSGSGEWTYV